MTLSHFNCFSLSMLTALQAFLPWDEYEIGIHLLHKQTAFFPLFHMPLEWVECDCQAKHDVTMDLKISLNYRKCCMWLQLCMAPPTLKYTLMGFYHLNTCWYSSIPVASPTHPFILQNVFVVFYLWINVKRGDNRFHDTNHLCFMFLCDFY